MDVIAWCKNTVDVKIRHGSLTSISMNGTNPGRENANTIEVLSSHRSTSIALSEPPRFHWLRWILWQAKRKVAWTGLLQVVVRALAGQGSYTLVREYLDVR